MKSISICPQTLFEFELPADLLADALASVRKLEYLPNEGNVQQPINFMSVETFILESVNFAGLKSWIQTCINEVNEEVYKLDGIRITQSWANMAGTGMWHHFHKHSNSIVSGIIYLTNNNSRTWFSLNSMWYRSAYSAPTHFPPILEYVSDSDIKRVIHKEETVAGKCIIFPSSLHHSVDENLDTHNRRSISFNTFIEGTIGSESERNVLTF